MTRQADLWHRFPTGANQLDEPRTSSPCGLHHTHALRQQGGMPKPQDAAGWHAQASRRGHGVPAKRGHHAYPTRTSEEEPRTSSPCCPHHTHALRQRGGMPKPQGAGMACRRREDIMPTQSEPRKKSHGLPVRAAMRQQTGPLFAQKGPQQASPRLTSFFALKGQQLASPGQSVASPWVIAITNTQPRKGDTSRPSQRAEAGYPTLNPPVTDQPRRISGIPR